MKIVLGSCLLLLAMLKMSTSFSQQDIQNEKTMIVGAWVAEEGTRKLVFTSTTCREFYDGKLDNSYSYKITNNSVQCGQKVHVNENRKTSYLELTNLKGGSKTCYEINGVNAETLSITELSAPDPAVFKRKKNAQETPAPKVVNVSVPKVENHKMNNREEQGTDSTISYQRQLMKDYALCRCILNAYSKDDTLKKDISGSFYNELSLYSYVIVSS